MFTDYELAGPMQPTAMMLCLLDHCESELDYYTADHDGDVDVEEAAYLAEWHETLYIDENVLLRDLPAGWTLHESALFEG